MVKMSSHTLNFILLLICSVIADDDPCIRDTGEPGKCVAIAQCPEAIMHIDNKEENKIENCGFTDQRDAVKVCCSYSGVSDQSVYDPNDGCGPITYNIPKFTPSGRKAWNKCLEYQAKLVYPCEQSVALVGGYERGQKCHHDTDKLIIGGMNADELEFPHMVLLGYKERPNIEWLCGGSLISERFVLSAGHCISTEETGEVKYVAVGAYDKKKIQDSNIFNIERIIRHPQYDPPQRYYDIVLLKVDRDVPLSHTIVPACVHIGNVVDDSMVVATGWGLTEYKGSGADILQRATLVDMAEQCIEKNETQRLFRLGYQDDLMLCYGDPEHKKDTCQGDSGGPVQIKTKEMFCMYTIVGVTATGKGCGFEDEPSIYTRVAHFIDWIESYVWP